MMMISNTLGDQSLSGLNIQNGNEKSMKFRGTFARNENKNKKCFARTFIFFIGRINRFN